MKINRLLFIVATVAISIGLTACGGSSGDNNNGGAETFEDVKASDLERKAFTIPADFFLLNDPLAGKSATLAFGTFEDSDNDANPDSGIFSLTTGDGDLVAGTVSLGSCTFAYAFQALDGEDPVELDPEDPENQDTFDPCQIGSNGRLRITAEEDGELIAYTFPPATATTPAEFDIDISPQFETPVDENHSVALEGRSETGSFTAKLMTGNILEYSITVNSLSSEDGLTDAHIHSGIPTANGPVEITLVGNPVSLNRTTDILFAGGASVNASIALTPGEVGILTDPNEPLYVNIHSEQVAAGLLRGQMQILSPVADAGADQTVTEGDAVTLNGVASSDPDGNIITYSWQQTSGSPVQITDSDSAQATFTAPEVEAEGATFTFQLTVTDNDDLSDTDSLVVVVNDSPVSVPVSFKESIQPIYTANCVKSGCHNGTSHAGGLNLEAGQAWDNIVNVPTNDASNFDRVEPGEPENSYIYLKHTGAPGILGSRMPLDNPNFFDDNPDLLELERLWIEQGALDN